MSKSHSRVSIPRIVAPRSASPVEEFLRFCDKHAGHIVLVDPYHRYNKDGCCWALFRSTNTYVVAEVYALHKKLRVALQHGPGDAVTHSQVEDFLTFDAALYWLEDRLRLPPSLKAVDGKPRGQVRAASSIQPLSGLWPRSIGTKNALKAVLKLRKARSEGEFMLRRRVDTPSAGKRLKTPPRAVKSRSKNDLASRILAK